MHNLLHGKTFLLVQSSVGGKGRDWGGQCFQSPRPSHCARLNRWNSPRAASSSPLNRRKRWNTWRRNGGIRTENKRVYVHMTYWVMVFLPSRQQEAEMSRWWQAEEGVNTSSGFMRRRNKNTKSIIKSNESDSNISFWSWAISGHRRYRREQP